MQGRNRDTDVENVLVDTVIGSGVGRKSGTNGESTFQVFLSKFLVFYLIW